MKFAVQFVSNEGRAVKARNEHHGLDVVDMAREATGVPELRLDIIDDYVYHGSQDPMMLVDEETARASGLFKACSMVFIEVPKGALNRYQYLVPVVERDKETGEVKAVNFKYALDYGRVLADWKAAGYPVNWYPGHDEEEEN